MVGESTRSGAPSLDRRHKLRGMEHAKELDVSHKLWSSGIYSYEGPKFVNVKELISTLSPQIQNELVKIRINLQERANVWNKSNSA